MLFLRIWLFIVAAVTAGLLLVVLAEIAYGFMEQHAKPLLPLVAVLCVTSTMAFIVWLLVRDQQ